MSARISSGKPKVRNETTKSRQTGSYKKFQKLDNKQFEALGWLLENWSPDPDHMTHAGRRENVCSSIMIARPNLLVQEARKSPTGSRKSWHYRLTAPGLALALKTCGTLETIRDLARKTIIPFGRFAGEPLIKCPDRYIQWMIEQAESQKSDTSQNTKTLRHIQPLLYAFHKSRLGAANQDETAKDASS